ncbi:hypothetical protein ACIGEZ_13960 [Streptomyces sp. NPDC085481]|uniref:hypothetical protein n=1 Tax=Streptomyces sp. NPDC085481 TaxID=3365727 RepID=UPI0037D4B6E0
MRRRLLHACGALAAGGALLLAGCSSGADGKPDGKGRTSASATGRPTTSPTAGATPSTLDFTPDPKRAPKNAAEARRLALAIVAGPDAWGPGYVKRTPYLSQEGYWPVLGADCTWDGGTQPGSVLSSVTASMEIPATGGKGALRVSATVTVHRTEDDADWEMAGTLEEALRCPDQELREGEHITGLISLGNPFGVGGNYTASDSLGERGFYVSSGVKGKQIYGWYQSRIGQVTVATVVKGAPGYGEKDTPTTKGTINAQVQALVTMLERLKAQLAVQS